MIKSTIEKISESIGYDIGMSDDITQSNLINGFCKAISNSMDKHHREMQISYIVDKLNQKSEGVIEEIYQFIKLKKS